MGEVKNLGNTEGIKKIKELAEDIRVCMFCTATEKIPFNVRPMNTLQVDDDGNFWFFSSIDSDKNNEILQDDVVQLLYSKVSDNHYMTVTGRAEISKDRAKIEELWTDFIKAWFPKGKADPALTVICIKPQEAYYWDTKNGKMISLIKIALSAIAGKDMDGSVEGEIKV
jgi:general stress protein 26